MRQPETRSERIHRYSKVHKSGRKIGEIGNAVHRLNQDLKKLSATIFSEIMEGKGCMLCAEERESEREKE